MKSRFENKDRLENFIRENRAAFDSDEPSDLWSGIEEKLNKGSGQTSHHLRVNHNKWKRQFTYDWRVAAAILVFLAAGILFYVNRQYGLTRDPQMALKLPAYAKEVNYYTQIINEKRNDLRSMTAGKPELYHEFSSELDRLEKAYSGLRSELPESPDPDTHLHAMIQNLQWQIELLNQQITIIEKIRQANEDENIDSDYSAI